MIAPGTDAISDTGDRAFGFSWLAKRARWVGALVLSCAAVVAAAGCDKVPLTAPSDSVVTLFSNTTIVPVNGTADITATVIESAGTAVQNGTLVTFTTTLGVIDPGEARTRDGKATVRLVASGRSGRATIRAFSGGITSEDLLVDIGGAAAGRITLNANPPSVSTAGGTVALLAVVFDVDGNRLAGVPVSFTTTAGTIASSVVTSNSNGEASTTITTNRDSTVTATAGGRADGTPITAQAAITATALPTVTISASTTTPTARQPVSFTISATATAPNAVRSVIVDYGDGSSDSFGAVTSAAHVYNSSGTYRVTATVEDTSGARGTGSTTIVVSPASPILASLAAAPSSTTTGTVVVFTVTISQNPSNIPVQSVSFNFGDGNVSPAEPSLTRTHIYGTVNTFLVTATIRFVNGDSVPASTAVIVR